MSYAWTGDGHQSNCIRYFASDGIDGAPVVIIMLHGDRNRWLSRAPGDIPQNTRAQREHLARRQAQRAGVPVILLARPGVYGSSGDHRERRQKAEFTAIKQAIGLIRTRHRIGKIALLGHSGGATAAAAVLTLGQSDISCTVLTSGAFDLVARDRHLRRRSGRSPMSAQAEDALHKRVYDPLQNIDGIIADRKRSIHVLGDPRDTVTPFAFQSAFADRLRAAGHIVFLRVVPGDAPAHHKLTGSKSLALAANCAHGSH